MENSTCNRTKIFPFMINWTRRLKISNASLKYFLHQTKLLVASPSKFHDQTLIEATAKINQIMAEIPADNEGRRASLLA